METFTWIVILLVVASVLVGLARRVGAPYPAFLALAGVGVALVPGSPDIRNDPTTRARWADREIADEAYHLVQEELDWAELSTPPDPAG